MLLMTLLRLPLLYFSFVLTVNFTCETCEEYCSFIVWLRNSRNACLLHLLRFVCCTMCWDLFYNETPLKILVFKRFLLKILDFIVRLRNSLNVFLKIYRFAVVLNVLRILCYWRICVIRDLAFWCLNRYCGWCMSYLS